MAYPFSFPIFIPTRPQVRPGHPRPMVWGALKPGLSLCSTPPPPSGRGELLSLVVAEIQERKDKEALTQEGALQ